MSLAGVPDDPLAGLMPGYRLARGVCRALTALGFVCLTEVPLANGRRADVVALAPAGEIMIIEVKSSVADFQADRKWPEYRGFCDRLLFAVADDFPDQILPGECGLIRADPFGAVLVREGVTVPLSPARRKAMTLRFARTAAARLSRFVDPSGQVSS